MSRRKARETALQALFQLDFNKVDKMEALSAALEENESLRESARAYAEQLLECTLKNLEQIDALITQYSKNWKVERMSGVDRNVVRMAVYEMKFSEEKITPNIVINEAVELARKFGSDESVRFVNGVLDTIAKQND